MTDPVGAMFDKDARATLAALADVLIPAAGSMPAASHVDVHGRWLDRVLEARSDIAAPLLRVLTAAQGLEPMAEVQRLREEDPDGFSTLFLAVTGGYYMNPSIKWLIGYPDQQLYPLELDDADYFLRDGILEPVIERGPIYRPIS